MSTSLADQTVTVVIGSNAPPERLAACLEALEPQRDDRVEVLVHESEASPPELRARFPWATFTVNILGALMLGYFVTRLQERLPVSTLRRPLLGTGLCGALTTFSTVQIELLQMADHHRYGLAAAYLMASVLCGYLAVFLSSALVRRVRALV